MTRYVIGPDVAIRLADNQAAVGDEHQILAPTLFRSQLLSLLYQAAQRGELTKADALITHDEKLADAVKDLVTIATIEALS